MPKKTRQGKILAELRRLQERQKKAEKIEVQAISETQPRSLDLKSLSPAPSPMQALETNYSYVFSDLRKTVIFATLALVFEIILSFVLTKGSIFG